jgi:RNA polymerase sigma factor (TIGR02999 family)
LQATALVHEAFLRLAGPDGAKQSWNSRGHFFAAAAEAMRRILIDRARRKGRLRHGGDRQRVDLDTPLCVSESDGHMLCAVDDALEKLASSEPEAAQVVKLRYFAGLTFEETAAAMNLSVRTVNRHWTCAWAWLYRQLDNGER